MISRCYVPRSSMVMAAFDAAPGLVNLSGLMDDAKCFAFVRQRRWPEGVRCPGCGSVAVIRDGCDDSQPHRQRYRCKGCARRFDDLTGRSCPVAWCSSFNLRLGRGQAATPGRLTRGASLRTARLSRLM